MSGDDAILEDQCFKELYGNFGNFQPFKQEFGAAAIHDFDFEPSDPLAMDSAAMPQTIHQLQSRLPSMPLMSISPTGKYDMYSASPLMSTASLFRNSLYANAAPDTPPDTPPVNSPGSANLHNQYQHLLEHHQYPHIQSVSKEPTPVAGFDSMTWMSESIEFPRSVEPLDLRGSYSSESWNVMQQHTSVITAAAAAAAAAAASVKRFLPNTNTTTATYPQHRKLSQCSSQTSVSSSSKTAKTKSAAGTVIRPNLPPAAAATPAASPPHGEDPNIEDRQLTDLSVKDLNLKLKSLPKEKQTKFKQKRRTLKNRIYAQNCRKKREDQKKQLQMQNNILNEEIVSLRGHIRQLMNEKSLLEQRLDTLRDTYHHRTTPELDQSTNMKYV